MKPADRNRAFIFTGEFLLGGITIMCANQLELSCERKLLFSNVLRTGATTECSLVAAFALLLGLGLAITLGALTVSKEATTVRRKVGKVAIDLVFFVLGIIVGGIFVPVR